MVKDITAALEEIRQDFLGKLSGKISDLRKLIQRIESEHQGQEAYDLLHRAAHNLAGSAGTYGLPRVSEVAQCLELAIASASGSGEPKSKLDGALKIAMIRLEEAVQLEINRLAPSLVPAPAKQAVPLVSPLICLVEDDLEQALHVIQILEFSQYHVRHFLALDDFISAIDLQESPSAVLMDMMFPEGDLAGVKAIERLREKYNNFPPVIFLSIRDDVEARIAAYRAGASHYVVKPVDGEKLISCLDRLTLRVPSRPYRILMVDDEPLLLSMNAEILRQSGMDVRTEESPLEVLKVMKEFQPELLVLDVYMPDISGPELAALIREDETYLSLPILFLSAEMDISKQLMALSLGGDHFLVKPVDPSHLVTVVSTRVRRYREVREIETSLKRTLYEREREHLALNYHNLVSIADKKGLITYVNERFCEVSGYHREELLGENHRIIKSGVHPVEFYQEMWKVLLSGKVWQGIICNLSKQGQPYWVDSTIVPFLDDRGIPYQYISIRTDITQLKSLELGALDSAERLHRSQVFANIGTWDWDIQTGEIFWSEQIAAMFGHPGCELKINYVGFMKAVHPDDRKEVRSAINRCIDQGEEYEVDHRVIWPDGQVRWVRQKGNVIRDEKGTSLRMLGVTSDIHEKKMAKETIDSFKATLDMTQDGVFMFDPDSLRYFYCNLGATEHFGFSTMEMMNLTPVDLMPEYDESEFRQTLAPLMAGTIKLINHETVFRHKDGHEIPVDISLQYVKPRVDAARFVAIVRNISVRKQTEEDLKIFRRIFESTEQGIVVSDSSGNIIYCNNSHDEIFGRSQDQVVGKHFDRYFSPETKVWAADEIMAALREGISWAGLLTILDAEDHEITIAANIGYINDQKGTLQYIFNIFGDYSEEIKWHQQLASAKDIAERANQAKSEFLSSMSHELRTPLNAILGFAQLLHYDKTLNEQNNDSVHEILKAGRHLLTLINEVLDLARIESGRINISLEAVEVHSVVKESLSLVELLASNCEIELCHDIPEGVYVQADRVRLKQVLLNLLSNAIKYNKKGGKVTLKLQICQKDKLRILVSDTGPGIPEERLSELFQPFKRLEHENSEIEGTGIGLTITRRIIELMEGSVDVKSEVGVGSTFWIELTLLKMDQSTEILQSAEGSEREIQPIGAGQHVVLYIEDNPSNLKLVSRLLGARENIHLLTAHAPGLGIDLARSQHPDLILLDINMPQMDGYQVLDVIKADEKLKNVPLVAVSANAMPEDIKRGKDAGFDEYLTKPLDVIYFLKVVDRFLGMKK